MRVMTARARPGRSVFRMVRVDVGVALRATARGRGLHVVWIVAVLAITMGTREPRAQHMHLFVT